MYNTLILTPQAEKDFDLAYNWYESQDTGLGKEFARCVDVKIHSLIKSSQHYPIIYNNIVRRALINRFPFSIYFTEQESVITIVAILHHRRNPQLWMTRR